MALFWACAEHAEHEQEERDTFVCIYTYIWIEFEIFPSIYNESMFKIHAGVWLPPVPRAALYSTTLTGVEV